jgi:hypothetical protein
MAYIALITWFGTILAGLYMLAVWLIENDVTPHGSAPSRLPPVVIFGHLGLAVTGLAVWVAYLVLGRDILAWTAVSILGLIAVLGATMFLRWIPASREPALAGTPAPPEGSFPVVVVAGHGLLASSTAVLVLLTALGFGGS